MQTDICQTAVAASKCSLTKHQRLQSRQGKFIMLIACSRGSTSAIVRQQSLLQFVKGQAMAWGEGHGAGRVGFCCVSRSSKGSQNACRQRRGASVADIIWYTRTTRQRQGQATPIAAVTCHILPCYSIISWTVDGYSPSNTTPRKKNSTVDSAAASTKI